MNPYVGRTHSGSTRYRRGNSNANLTYAINCGGNQILKCFSHRKEAWHQFTHAVRMEDLTWAKSCINYARALLRSSAMRPLGDVGSYFEMRHLKSIPGANVPASLAEWPTYAQINAFPKTAWNFNARVLFLHEFRASHRHLSAMLAKLLRQTILVTSLDRKQCLCSSSPEELRDWINPENERYASSGQSSTGLIRFMAGHETS